ncbi:hypothetical protein ABTZ03_14590 [Kitasatospora sp. NPDC096077]|uniref:hypothetical protein n=1 Tax=Kitasatospora sp. NPDC096077 TaxID=3155544 RepID=UPI003331CE4C
MLRRAWGIDGPSAGALCLGAMTFGTADNYAFRAPGGTGHESEELLGRLDSAG